MKFTSPDEAKALRTMAGAPSATAPAAAPAFSAARRVSKRIAPAVPRAGAASKSRLFILMSSPVLAAVGPRLILVAAKYDNLLTAGQQDSLPFPLWSPTASAPWQTLGRAELLGVFGPQAHEPIRFHRPEPQLLQRIRGIGRGEVRLRLVGQQLVGTGHDGIVVGGVGRLRVRRGRLQIVDERVGLLQVLGRRCQ